MSKFATLAITFGVAAMAWTAPGSLQWNLAKSHINENVFGQDTWETNYEFHRLYDGQDKKIGFDDRIFFEFQNTCVDQAFANATLKVKYTPKTIKGAPAIYEVTKNADADAIRKCYEGKQNAMMFNSVASYAGLVLVVAGGLFGRFSRRRSDEGLADNLTLSA